MARRAPTLDPSPDATTERSAVEAAQRDPRRFDELYEANFERVYAYVARRLRDRDAACDVTSEVFHRALEHLPRFEWRGVPFVAWLLRIAAHAIADRAARGQRDDQTVRAQAREQPSPDTVPALDLAEAEERARLFRSVDALPAEQRRVILLRFAEERSIREIAATLGRSEGAVKQLQFRGLQTLRSRLGERHG
jgi:RNA polymerase sigma-70 factor (ECF subfamily)